MVVAALIGTFGFSLYERSKKWPTAIRIPSRIVGGILALAAILTAFAIGLLR